MMEVTALYQQVFRFIAEICFVFLLLLKFEKISSKQLVFNPLKISVA